MNTVRITELGYINHDTPIVTDGTPAELIALNPASDGTTPNGMRVARYITGSWADEEAAQLEAELAAQAAEQAVNEAKALGFTYNGIQVPVTNADAVGALQIEAGFERMNMQSTSFHLSNGAILPLTLAEWPSFKAAFFSARAAFFQG